MELTLVRKAICSLMNTSEPKISFNVKIKPLLISNVPNAPRVVENQIVASFIIALKGN